MNHPDKSVDANAAYHQRETLDALAGLKERYSVPRLWRTMREDFRKGAELAVAEKPIALDCLTGTGQYADMLRECGFAKVVGVDLSADEIAIARKDFADNNALEFVCAELGEFLESRANTFDFIYLGSLHHIADYGKMITSAARSLRPDGSLYILERKRQSSLARLLVKLDDHLFTFLSSPRLWWARISNRLGFGRSPAAKAFGMAAAAEVHAVSGLDEDMVRRNISAEELELVLDCDDYFPATRLFSLLYRLLGLRDMMRIIARKKPSPARKEEIPFDHDLAVQTTLW